MCTCNKHGYHNLKKIGGKSKNPFFVLHQDDGKNLVYREKRRHRP